MFEWLINLFWQPKPVNSYEDALEIGKATIYDKWPDDYSSFNIDLWDDQKNGVWHFRYFCKRNPGEILLGGIGPGVDIRKSDSRITYLKGQK